MFCGDGRKPPGDDERKAGGDQRADDGEERDLHKEHLPERVDHEREGKEEGADCQSGMPYPRVPDRCCKEDPAGKEVEEGEEGGQAGAGRGDDSGRDNEACDHDPCGEVRGAVLPGKSFPERNREQEEGGDHAHVDEAREDQGPQAHEDIDVPGDI